MGKFTPKKEISHGVDEVTFKNHISEFQRFYYNHKSFCDEIAGLKPRSIKENGEVKEFFINKDNFIFAIRKLFSFVIDNLHYIKSVSDMRSIEKSCYDLEEDFVNNKRYSELSRKSRTNAEDVELNKMYLNYVVRIYEIGNHLMNLLQNSLMIATSRVSKDIEYHNETAFFDELSRYRTEISDTLSNFRFSDTLTAYKKILGYHYTYRILLKDEEQVFTEKLLKSLLNEILKEDYIKLLIKVKNDDPLTSDERDRLNYYYLNVKIILNNIYYITNKNLSERKILPKILKKLHVDKTLI